MNDFSTHRRRLLAAGLVIAAGARPARAAPAPIPYHGGRVSPPLPLPPLPLELSDGSRTDLAALTAGRATAIHLMFTGCSTTCPIQGVVFRRTQELLRDAVPRGIRLVSLSVDPLADTPATMRAWLGRFGAAPGWTAARPTPEGLETVQRYFGGGNGSGALADHATEVSIVDARSRLIWRTYELPSPESLAGMLNQV